MNINYSAASKSNFTQRSKEPKFGGIYLVKGSSKAIDEFSYLAKKHSSISNEEYAFLQISPSYGDPKVWTEMLCTSKNEAFRFWQYSWDRFGNIYNAKRYYQDKYCNSDPKIYAKYEHAKKIGDKNSIADIIIDGIRHGRELISTIFGADTKLKEVKAENAIDAIYKNKFDFAEGNILE